MARSAQTETHEKEQPLRTPVRRTAPRHSLMSRCHEINYAATHTATATANTHSDRAKPGGLLISPAWGLPPREGCALLTVAHQAHPCRRLWLSDVQELTPRWARELTRLSPIPHNRSAHALSHIYTPQTTSRRRAAPPAGSVARYPCFAAALCSAWTRNSIASFLPASPIAP